MLDQAACEPFITLYKKIIPICQLFSSYINPTINGISMDIPNIIRSMPTAKKTVLLLFIFEIGDYLKIFEIQHNKSLLYLYFAYKI